MREIIFRGKTIIGEKWVTGHLMYWGGNYQIWETENDGETHNYQVIPETVGQFTGLLDRNGNKIFEGDTLKIIVDNEYDEDETFIGTVIFGRNGKNVGKNFITDYPCSFTLYVKEWCHQEGLLGNSRHELEIIGNIHESLTPTK